MQGLIRIKAKDLQFLEYSLVTSTTFSFDLLDLFYEIRLRCRHRLMRQQITRLPEPFAIILR